MPSFEAHSRYAKRLALSRAEFVRLLKELVTESNGLTPVSKDVGDLISAVDKVCRGLSTQARGECEELSASQPYGYMLYFAAQRELEEKDVKVA